MPCKIEKSGNLLKIHEKPNNYFLINIGIYCIEKKILKGKSKKDLGVGAKAALEKQMAKKQKAIKK